MKYIGHLDVMRYFQKAIRRAGFDVSYSEGFSPHMLMSFAAPLGVGITSDSEYFDLDLKDSGSSAEMTEALDREMAPGMKVRDIRQIPEDKKSKGMTLVAAASYTISWDAPDPVRGSEEDFLRRFLSQESVPVEKKTKKSMKTVDIRPLIYRMEYQDGAFRTLISQGSVNNLNPKLLMSAFADFCEVPLDELALRINRDEIYADTGSEGARKLVPLIELGETIGKDE